MKGFLTGILAVCLLFITGIVLIAGMYIHYNSREVYLRTEILQKQKLNEASFTTMFQILKEKAGLTEKDREDFKKFYPEIMGKTYENDKNLLAKFVQTKIPNWNTDLYKSLMNSIEAERHRFYRDQTELAALKVEHDTLLGSPVSGWFIGNKPKIEITIVTSGVAQDTFKSGTDDTDPLNVNKPAAKPPVNK